MGEKIFQCSGDVSKAHPEWSYDVVAYELNFRQFTPLGTIAQASLHLDRLALLGVNLLWLMPFYPIGEERRKGALGSYYSIRDYCAVGEEFGTMDDIVEFVAQAHQKGMRVLFDFVANHTSRDSAWIDHHPDWYDWTENRSEVATPFDWTDTAKLNYENEELRQAMIDSMKFWVNTAKVDGFRCDMAMLVPIEFWEEAVRQLGSSIFMLAEAEGEEFHRRAFDATYRWEMHHLFERIANSTASAGDLVNRLRYENSAFGAKPFGLNFTSNHDENSWNGSEFSRFGSVEAVKMFAALTFILPGIPLIYSGQEVGLDRQLEFFDRDTIDWNSDGLRANLFTSFYTQLCDLKHHLRVLRGGERGGDVVLVENSQQHRIFSLKRKHESSNEKECMIAVFNMSNSEAVVKFWDEDFEGQYLQFGSKEQAQLFTDRDFYLPPWGFFIYYRQ